jgi:hypothetical protein
MPSTPLSISVSAVITGLLPDQEICLRVEVSGFSANLKQISLVYKKKTLNIVWSKNVVYAYFSKKNGECLVAFFKWVEDQGWVISNHAIKYGMKKSLGMSVEDVVSAISPVLRDLGYAKDDGAAIYKCNGQGGNLEVAVTTSNGITYLHMHGGAPPLKQQEQWDQLLACLTPPHSSDELTPRTKAAAVALCSLDNGDGSPAASTRSKRPKVD